MNVLNQYIQSRINEYAKENGIELTSEQLFDAIRGVEYAVNECMTDSINDAVSFTLPFDLGDDNE